MFFWLKEFIRMGIRKFFTYAPDTVLARSKSYQREKFASVSNKFTEIYLAFNAANSEKYILGTWKDLNNRFLEMCKNGLPIDFLQHRIVLDTLTSNPVFKPIWKPFFADLLREAPPNFISALEEELIGFPRIVESMPLTSPGRIVHGWTLFQFLKKTNAVDNINREDLSNVIEYGGGYGGLCVVWKRLNPLVTYTIIDTPVMLAIQWIYLTSVFGEDSVFSLTSKNATPQIGKINLMPVAFIDRADIVADVFVSTWALSESIALAQETIIHREWYQAKHLMLAFQKASVNFPYAESFRNAALNRGGEIQDLPYIFEGDSSAIFI